MYLVLAFLAGVIAASAGFASWNRRRVVSSPDLLSIELEENSDPDVMKVIISSDRVRRYVSPASKKILGYEPEELIGTSPTAGIHPDDRAHTMEVSESLVRGARARITRYRHMHKDGHYVWLEAHFTTKRDSETGLVKEFIGTVRDISDRATNELIAEEELARLREGARLLQMAEAMANVGHWRVDLVGGSLFWSKEVYKIHGVPEDFEPDLRKAVDFYHPEDRDYVNSTIQSAIDSLDDFEFSARIVRPDGEVRHVASLGQCETAPTGEVVGIFGVFKDITVSVEARQELKEARDRAEAAVASKSAFLANMSHEIRTPMNSVIGFAELLATSDLDEEYRSQARQILESGQSMMRLLNDLLDFSKVEAGRLELQVAPADIHHLLRGTLGLISPEAAEKGLECKLLLAEDIPQWIEVDKLRLRQIVLNLLNNALKFTDRGSIILSARTEGDADAPMLIIAVEDTGIGIPKKSLEAIFEYFEQATPEIHKQFGGTGLGLAISKELAQLMGGTLAVQSTVDHGSRFTVSIPLIEADKPEAVVAVEAPVAATATTARVLVAEDNAVNQMLMAALLEKLGVQHDLAEDGKAAVEAVTEAEAAGSPYDVVLMDIQMPRMDGYEATRHLRQSGFTPAKLPIVALTANAFAEDTEKVLQAGMQAHLTKPIKIETLSSLIAKYTKPSGVVGGF